MTYFLTRAIFSPQLLKEPVMRTFSPPSSHLNSVFFTLFPEPCSWKWSRFYESCVGSKCGLSYLIYHCSFIYFNFDLSYLPTDMISINSTFFFLWLLYSSLWSDKTKIHLQTGKDPSPTILHLQACRGACTSRSNLLVSRSNLKDPRPDSKWKEHPEMTPESSNLYGCCNNSPHISPRGFNTVSQR